MSGGGVSPSSRPFIQSSDLFLLTKGQYYYRPGLGLDDIQILATLEYRPKVNINFVQA